MNYNMQGDNRNDSQALRDAEIDEGRNQEKHQVLMVNKTTKFKKGKGKKNFKKDGKGVATPVKKPKAGPKPETECFYCKGNGHWKRNYPKYLADKKDGKVNKGIFDVHVIDVYLTSACSSLAYLIYVRLLRLVTQKRSYRINKD